VFWAHEKMDCHTEGAKNEGGKVKVCSGKHQHALRKGYKLVLTLARAPLPKIEKDKQQRLMRIQRVVSHAIWPVPSPPEASRSVVKPPSDLPLSLSSLLKCILSKGAAN